MRIRGTQKVVKPVEVNVDTVYVRTNITRIEEEDTGDIGGFVGWEYDEVQFDKNEYISNLTYSEDTEGIAFLLSLMMSEIDMLRMEVSGIKEGD